MTTHILSQRGTRYYVNFIDVRAQSGLAILRAFGGIFLIILTARVIGLEYQLGTIRILLARGVGRLQLLLVKLLTIVLVALLILVVGLLLNVALMYGLVLIL